MYNPWRVLLQRGIIKTLFKPEQVRGRRKDGYIHRGREVFSLRHGVKQNLVLGEVHRDVDGVMADKEESLFFTKS